MSQQDLAKFIINSKIFAELSRKTVIFFFFARAFAIGYLSSAVNQ
jgi:hypothetical protein